VSAAGGLPGFGETLVSLPEVFGHHARLPDDGHKIGITLPSGDDVHVHVGGDPSASRGAKVETDIEALGVIDLFHHAYSFLNQQHHFIERFGGEI